MKIEVIEFNEETGEIELDLDDEGQQYLIQLGFEMLMDMSRNEVDRNEKNR